MCVGPLMTAFTSDRLHDAAVKVPCALAAGAKKGNKARKGRVNKYASLLMLSVIPVSLGDFS